MKDIYKIGVALLGFAAVFLLVDMGVGRFFDWAIKQLPSEGERVAKSEYVMNKETAEFVVLGSSRAEGHYDSHVIKETYPEYGVFNCGVDGQSFYYITTLFNTIMDRYTPKVVVWDFKMNDLVEDTPENLSLIYPYYHSNRWVKEILDKQDPSLKYALLSNCYRYNGTASRILRAMRIKESNQMGFLSHKAPDATRKFVHEEKVLEKQQQSVAKVSYLRSALERAKKKNIKIVLCVSPLFNRYVGESATIKCLHDLSKEYDILFVDKSQDKQFMGLDELWYDTVHLNATGAKMFTEDLMKRKDVEQYLKSIP